MIVATLDTNVLIKATKPTEGDHLLSLRLLDLHKQGMIRAQIVAANASEYGRTLNGEVRSLQSDLMTLGLREKIHILPIPLILNVSYLGMAYLVGEATVDLMKNVWATMFNSIPMEHDKFCEHLKVTIPSPNDKYLDRRWRNYMCDVLTITEYIRECSKSDGNYHILVTADSDDIIRNAAKLEKLGAQRIRALKDAVLEIDGLLASGGQ
jgi:hypothetical protein